MERQVDTEQASGVLQFASTSGGLAIYGEFLEHSQLKHQYTYAMPLVKTQTTPSVDMTSERNTNAAVDWIALEETMTKIKIDNNRYLTEIITLQKAQAKLIVNKNMQNETDAAESSATINDELELRKNQSKANKRIKKGKKTDSDLSAV